MHFFPRRFLFWHMVTVTPMFLVFIVSILIAGATDDDWLAGVVADGSFLMAPGAQTAMNVTLIILGLLSVAAAYLHWRVGIEPLYSQPQETDSARGAEQQEDTVC